MLLLQEICNCRHKNFEMYKILCLLLICVDFLQAEDHTIQITWGEMYQGLTTLLSVKHDKNATNITWNRNVSENKNPLRATYKFIYTSLNKTRSANTSNLCTPAPKGSVMEVSQTFLLKTITNSENCPIKKGTTVSYSTPFKYTYKINKSYGCGEFKAEMKLFRQNRITNLFPILVHKFGGTVSGC
ncbi:uncharacterized protein LOC122501887 [Leptopilina heterotoma]|uniref:uncharacterized protein LOC122501887 n=1 Tax=Leptopilina heterotoma TaxID=63436 RepID=UPI001CA8E6B7|nr:uncharacterized protein LOC122501887 [Leptopilina heterotoma]